MADIWGKIVLGILGGATRMEGNPSSLTVVGWYGCKANWAPPVTERRRLSGAFLWRRRQGAYLSSLAGRERPSR